MFLNPGSEVEDIVAIRAVDYAAVQLLFEGKFDKKIAEYKKAKEEADASQQIAGTFKMAEKLKSGAQAKADEVAAKAAALDAREADLKARELAVADKDANAIAKAAAAAKLADESVALKQKLDADAKQAQAAIDAREQSVIAQLKQLAIDRSALEAQKKEFNAKLESLRT